MRGKVARVQIKIIERNRVRLGKDSGVRRRGEEKMAVVIAHIIKILTYSAINKSANRLAPNSTLNPETSSDSPSAKSKGVRFVSARIVINQIIARGAQRSRGGANDWRIICLGSKVDRHIRIEIKISVIDTS